MKITDSEPPKQRTNYRFDELAIGKPKLYEDVNINCLRVILFNYGKKNNLKFRTEKKSATSIIIERIL